MEVSVVPKKKPEESPWGVLYKANYDELTEEERRAYLSPLREDISDLIYYLPDDSPLLRKD